jgi:4-hydroxythreonine-4-phosphate dehydrogenase
LKKILYSPGEPAGIGPDLIIQLSKSAFWTDIKIPILCLSDPKLLVQRSKDLGKKLLAKKSLILSNYKLIKKMLFK